MTELIIRLEDQTTDELKTELARSLQMTVENFRRIATIVKILEERGEDLANLRLSLLTYFRKIAHGQLSAAAVVRFAQRPDLLSRVSLLPLPDQDKMADGGPVPLVVRQGDALTTRLLDPLSLTRQQITQVFGKGAIRSQNEQIALLEDRREPKTKKVVRKKGDILIDKINNGLIIGRKFVSANDVLTALAELSEDEPSEDGDTAAINLSAAVVRCLRIQAARRDTTIKSLVVRACRACGLLRETN